MTLKKAIIPAAGLGTRMLPASNAFPKELLPVGTLPVFHYVLWEAARAGIETVVLVNADWKTELDNYLLIDPELDSRIRDTEKSTLLDSLRALAERIEIVSVRQREQKGLGHAVASALPVISEDEPFAVLLPDELILQGDGVLAELQAQATEDCGAVGVLEVPADQVHRYGIVAVDGSPPSRIADLVEKPSAESAPSRWAIIGRYLFPAGFSEALRNLRPGAGGELQLTDAMRDHLDRFPLQAVPVTGARFDTGNPEGYRHTWQAYLDDPDAFHRAGGMD